MHDVNAGLVHIAPGGELLAIVLPADYKGTGIQFFTADELSQQLAYMRHPEGHVIAPHIHNHVPREIQFTQEVLILRRGRLRVDFYSNSHAYLESRTLNAGDIILLISGGHGFVALEEIEMVEVKQGPYIGKADKTAFDGVPPGEVKIVK